MIPVHIPALSAQPKLVSQHGQSHQVFENAGPSALTVHGLTVVYNEKPALFSVDFTLPKGAMAAVIGPNGAGKSTFLKAILGVVPRVSGTMTFFDRPLDKVREKIAYVPQRASVDWDFPARVIDVVRMGLFREVGLIGRFGLGRETRVREALDKVGMADFADRQIGQLSGGQQQRVFLARALVQNADLYLLDEPFAGVDATTERAIIAVLRALQADGKTVMCVHHDLATVRDYFDHTLLLNICKVADGSLADSYTAENLQATYGGRLATAHIDQLDL